MYSKPSVSESERFDQNIQILLDLALDLRYSHPAMIITRGEKYMQTKTAKISLNNFWNTHTKVKVDKAMDQPKKNLIWNN